MYKHAFLTFSLLLMVISCSRENTRTEPTGYWSDSTGLAIFEIKPKGQLQYEIASSLGSLQGTLVENRVVGLTDLKDSFSVTISGDTAYYSILGVSLACHRIPKARYDSLSAIQGSP